MKENMSLAVTETNYNLSKADPSAIAAAETAKQRVQCAYVMAYQKPRNVEQARLKILDFCKKPFFAEKAEYSKPVGNKSIRGPSIRFAETAIREWGNILIQSNVIFEDDTNRKIQISVTDLESNATYTKDVSINKTVERKSKLDREVLGQRTNTNKDVVYIVKATEDELLNKENALISKAIRNEGLRVLPSDIVEEGMDTCRETLANKDAESPDAAKRKIIDAFHSIGVRPADLEKYLKHSLETIVPAELQDLRGVYQAISSGEARWMDYVAEVETPAKQSPLETAIKDATIPPVTPAAAKPEKEKDKAKEKPIDVTPIFDGISAMLKEIKAPVTVADIENYLRAKNKLGTGQTLAQNKKIEEAVKANLPSIVSQTADWKAENF